MSRLAGTGLAVLVLVGVPFGALAIGRTGAGSASVTAERHHYFLVGKRICTHALKRLPAGSRIAFLVSGKYPAPFRKDVSAGCRAAIGGLPLLGYGSPPPTS